ncbi:MAG: DUF2846 domain-containing protein [Bacteroidales bacterium]|jgi:hypothetical protein|nr:DUF2846 domain-containing protein [Bacteroidales bacterium]
MKHFVKNLFIFIFVCSSTSVFSQKFEPVEEIPEGKALVYIYRPGSMVGAAVHYSVNANEEKVSDAHLKNKTYLVYFADPGRYTFWAQVTNTRREVDLDVEAGKTYYIKGDCCEFILPDIKDAEKDIQKCKLSIPKD